MEFPVDTQKIDFSHKEIIEKIRSEYGHTLSSHSFASLYLWQHAMGLSLICDKDFFAVQCGGENSKKWFFPETNKKRIALFPRKCRISRFHCAISENVT